MTKALPCLQRTIFSKTSSECKVKRFFWWHFPQTTASLLELHFSLKSTIVISKGFSLHFEESSFNYQTRLLKSTICLNVSPSSCSSTFRFFAFKLATRASLCVRFFFCLFFLARFRAASSSAIFTYKMNSILLPVHDFKQKTDPECTINCALENLLVFPAFETFIITPCRIYGLSMIMQNATTKWYLTPINSNGHLGQFFSVSKYA